MPDLADGQYVPRVGTYLVENIKDQSRLSNSVIIKKPSAIIDRMKNVIAKNKNIESKVDANHALSQLSGVEKTMYGIGDQGVDISQYNPAWGTNIQMLEGNTGLLTVNNIEFLS